MWSGNMPGPGEAYPTQWALNPTSQYLHMPSEQVDWASLAQQWIKMKEETPQMVKEQGEAPMDITKEDAVPAAVATPTAVPATATPATPNPPTWSTSQIPTGSDSSAWWSWAQAAATGTWPVTGAPYTAEPTAVPVASATAQPYTYAATTAAPPAPDYTPPPPNLSNYWNEVRLPSGKEETSSWEGRNNRKQSTQVPEPTPEIDAVKRKQLPAWIREGLEKMEREKMKKAENERLERERKEALLNKPQGLEESSKVNVDGNGYEEPPKSKFETDSSESDTEDKEKAMEDLKPRKSRFDVRQPSPPKPVFRTKEQILQSVMIDVRKILTHILMEVTSEEIKKACEEVHRHFSRKAPATTLRKTQALTSLTGKLGLGIYGSDSESEDSGSEKVTNDPDSDQEIKARIERLKSEFASTEKSIEREYLEQEEREKRQLHREKRESSEEGDHSQVHSHPARGLPMEKPVEPHPNKVAIQSENSHQKEPTISQGESRGRDVEGRRSPSLGGRERSEKGGSRSERGESLSGSLTKKGGSMRSDRGGSRSERGESRSERGESRSERGDNRSESSRKRRRRRSSTSSSSSSESSTTSSSSSSSSDSSSRRRRKRRRHHSSHHRHHRHRSSSRSSSSPHRHSRHRRR